MRRRGACIPASHPSVARSQLALAFAAVYLLWGGTYLAIRVVVAQLSPLATICLRCAGGALVLVAWLAARRALRRSRLVEWVTQAAAGVLLFAGCHGLLAFAERRVSSGTAALYLATIPLLLVIWEVMRQRRLPRWTTVLGLALGVAGVAVLASSGGTGSGSPADRVLLLLAALCWALGSIVSRDGPRPASITQATAIQLGSGATILFIASALTDTGGVGGARPWELWALDARGAVALGFLVLGNVFGFTSYNWLLRETSPAVAGSYAFVNPVVAMLLAAAFGDERLTWRNGAAAALVLAAVGLTQSAGRRSVAEGR